MGNQSSSRGGAGSSGGVQIPDEPLEAYLREKQRNDHLKNLGLKRHTSLRKSISKKLKRHKTPKPSTAAADTTAAAEVCTTDGATSKNHCDVHEEQPFRRPSYGGGSQPNLATKVLLLHVLCLRGSNSLHDSLS